MRNQLMIIGATCAALATGRPGALAAQRVSADIHIGSWPVAGTIHIGDRYARPRPIPARIVVVERRHGGPFWRGHGARVVRVYYDPYDRRFYDRYYRGLEEVSVYQYGDHYYRLDDRYHDRRFDGPWGRDRDDRFDRDRRDRWERRDRDARDRRYRERDRDRDHDRADRNRDRHRDRDRNRDRRRPD